jgi:hypothetical protein
MKRCDFHVLRSKRTAASSQNNESGYNKVPIIDNMADDLRPANSSAEVQHPMCEPNVPQPAALIGN